MSRLATASLAELAALERILDPIYPEAWRDIATSLFLQLRAMPEVAGLGEDGVARTALSLTEGLRAEIGGSQPYLPTGKAYELSVQLSARDRQILARFNGHNHEQLAREFGLSVRQIYTVVERRAREEFERRQGRLGLEIPDEQETAHRGV